ncbi:tRNA (mnm(5)s(2)U34)-methyltransferase [Metabacillus arenae]|uniref:Methyltransferase domain-containing protein n=1 Tax=Metabacillus arenae TaxID=2771434 RepID=A0A926NFB8_9BACI|nr:class I SAM-dependent methyltransferase [Metabacillus arenae]MBD1380216.1 methyltransferase domain-containing protein [Metabacillus arenae]
MRLTRILPFSKHLLSTAAAAGDIVIDATAGNGLDTVFLAELVGEYGHVYGFDIQEEAILNTANRLKEKDLESRATLTLDSHEMVKKHIPVKFHGQASAAIFNLGYLPGGNKAITTAPSSTILAIEEILDLLKPEGIIIIVIYHGHETGKMERDAIIQYAMSIDQKKAHVLKYQFINQANNPPFIVAIEKR